MESETSDTTDSISADLISNVFNKLQDHKPSYLNEFEFSIFQYFGSMAFMWHSVAKFGSTFTTLVIIQYYTVMALTAATFEYNQYGKNSDIMKIMLFFVTFNFGDFKEIPSCTFFLILDCLSFLSILAFVCGWVMTLMKKHIKHYLLFTFYFVGLCFSSIIGFAEANYASKIIAKLITGKIHTYYFQAIYCFISFICHYAIQMFASCTLYQSVFFFYGSFAQFNGMNFVMLQYSTFNIILMVYNFCAETMSDKNLQIVISFIYIVFGLIMLKNGLSTIGFDNFLTYTARTFGCILIMDGMFGFLQLTHFIVDSHLILFVLLWGTVVLWLIFSFDDARKAVNLGQFFKTSNFEKFEVKNDLEYMLFIQIGFREAKASILNGDFIKWGLKKKRADWVYFGLFKFSTILLNTPCYEKDVKAHIDRVPIKTMTQKYILYEHFLTRNYQNTGDVPKDHHSAIAELEGRIAQFQSINQSFAKKISADSDTNFLLLDALGSMRGLISASVKKTKELYPNSPEVLNVYASYKSKIDGDQEAAIKWTNQADRLLSKEIIYANFQHTHCLDLFPKVQTKLLATATFVNPISKAKNISNSRSNYLPISKTVNDSYKALDIFNSRKNILQIVVNLIFFLTFISILVDYFLTYSNSYAIKKRFIRSFNYNSNMSNVIDSISSWLHMPIDMISRNKIRNVTIAQKRAKEYRTNVNNFNDMYKMLEFKTETLQFSSYYSWMTENLFNITSRSGCQIIHDTFFIYLTRFFTMFNNVFPEGITDGFYESEVTPAFVELFQESNYFLTLAIHKARNSTLAYMNEKIRGNHVSLYSSTIFVIVMCIIMMVLPIILHLELKVLTSLFPQNSLKDLSLLRTFLSQYFHSSKFFVAVYDLLIVLIIVISVANIEIVSKIYNNFLQVSLKKLEGIANDELHLNYLSTSLVSLLLSHHTFDILSNPTILSQNLLQSIKFFTSKGKSFDTISYSRINQYSYEFLLNAFHQVKNEKISYNFSQTWSMISNFERNLLPIIIEDINETYTYLFENLRAADVNSFTSIEISSFIIFGILLALFVILNRMKAAIPVIIQMLTYLPENYIATSDKFDILFQNRGQLSHPSETVEKSVLDYVNMPCAIIDLNDDIIITNRVWFNYFDVPINFTIGLPLSQFIVEGKTKYTITEVSHDYRLVVITQLKEDVEFAIKFKSLKHKLRSLQTMMIPKRFVGRRKPGVERLGFIMVAGIIFTPENIEEVNPEEWIEGVKLFENMLNLKCQETGDYDILKNNGRELMVLFGVNEETKPDYLLMSGMFTLVDILRWSIEYNWRGGGINISITVTVSDETEFVFRREKATVMEMFGPAFEKQMLLREKLELNSIVCCAETEKQLRKHKFGFLLDQVDENAYIFNIGNNNHELPQYQ